MKKIKNVTMLNALTNIILQITTIISGFIIPRMILKSFGSEVNGLVSSLNQILNYISILEGGVSSVIMANLYKPLLQNNKEKISSIVATSSKFFRKISVIFVVYSLGVAIIYPLVTHSSFSFGYVFALTIILAINLFIQYTFSLSWKILLNADKKVYIVSLIQILLIILNTIVFVVLINAFSSIHILKFISALVFCLQPILYKIAIDKYFKLDSKAKVDNSLIKERWNGFGINIAAFIHFNTDITILTVFTDLKTVSVYSVYMMVATGLRQLVMATSSGISPSVGQAYSKGNKEELNKMFDRYEFIIVFLTMFLFTIGAILITPFVMIYTSGVTDVNYFQPMLGYLLIIAEGIYCIRDPFISLAYSANKFKEITKPAYIEAILNIVISIIFVYKFKIVGVAFGTIVAMIYRAAFHIIYVKKHILNRPIRKFLKNFGCFFIISLIFVLISTNLFPIEIGSIKDWLIKAVIYCVGLFAAYVAISFLFFKNQFSYYKGLFIKNKYNKTDKNFGGQDI